MSNIKLIASDLDGTLLLNGAYQCGPEVFPLVRQLAEQNILFVAASGRQYQSLQRLFLPVKDQVVYLCENGAMAVYEGKVLLKEIFQRKLALEISNMVLQEPGCDIMISGEHTSYLMKGNPDFISYIQNDVGNDTEFIENPEMVKEDIIKVAARVPDALMDGAIKSFCSQMSGRCQVITSGNAWLDFLPIGVSKGSALRQIGNFFSIQLEEMAAFGDNENDRSMLETAGYPYLMRNCNPTMLNMKKQFLFCDRVEDELRKILEKQTCDSSCF